LNNEIQFGAPMLGLRAGAPMDDGSMPWLERRLEV